MRPKALSCAISFKSIEDGDMERIHAEQNGACRFELSQMLGFDEPWAPMSKSQIKEKMDEKRKAARSAVFEIWSDDEGFVGLASFSSSWDPWSPHAEVVIWPEHRRKGIARSAARMILDRMFDDHIANATSISVPEWSKAARIFVKSLGFKECGRMRRAGIRNGAFYDLVCYDLTKREYLAISKGAR